MTDQFTQSLNRSSLLAHSISFVHIITQSLTLWPQSLGTEVWGACLTFCPLSHSYTFQTSYTTRRRACGGHGRPAADKTNISWARFVERRQWFRGLKVGNQFKQRVDCREASWKIIRPQVHAGLREVISVCSVIIHKILSIVIHLLVFITAGNLNM